MVGGESIRDKGAISALVEGIHGLPLKVIDFVLRDKSIDVVSWSSLVLATSVNECIKAH